jgi:very-short-patch-repair endonuclease
MPTKRRNYSTVERFPRFKTERRIKMPQIIKRPARFQTRSLIRREELRKDPYWYTLHRRGPRRTWIGEDPLEARAVSHNLVRGTLPERIVWKYLVQNMRFVPDSDFDFQSSLQGGRVDTGGIVADFLFKIMMIVIQVQGPTHLEFRRIQKDNEQRLALEEMGYQVYELWEADIYDEERLDRWMKQTFSWYHSGGADTVPDFDDIPASAGFQFDKLFQAILDLRSLV